MAVQVSYPGVYIEEFAPGAPIQGVGTSTAAFIGVAARGPLDEPIKVTSFAQFVAMFGATPVQGSYLWYAVRGFFENGGRVCYVVRASNGRYQRLTLNDRTTPAPGRPVIDLRAREPGNLGITAGVADVPYLSAVELYRPLATLALPALQGAMEATVAADGLIAATAVANRFRAGDEVSFSSSSDRRVVASVSGAAVRFTLPLSQALARRRNAAACQHNGRHPHHPPATRRHGRAAGRPARAGHDPHDRAGRQQRHAGRRKRAGRSADRRCAERIRAGHLSRHPARRSRRAGRPRSHGRGAGGDLARDRPDGDDGGGVGRLRPPVDGPGAPALPHQRAQRRSGRAAHRGADRTAAAEQRRRCDSHRGGAADQSGGRRRRRRSLVPGGGRLHRRARHAAGDRRRQLHRHPRPPGGRQPRRRPCSRR